MISSSVHRGTTIKSHQNRQIQKLCGISPFEKIVKILRYPIPQATARHLDETDPITTRDVTDEPYWI